MDIVVSYDFQTEKTIKNLMLFYLQKKLEKTMKNYDKQSRAMKNYVNRNIKQWNPALKEMKKNKKGLRYICSLYYDKLW